MRFLIASLLVGGLLTGCGGGSDPAPPGAKPPLAPPAFVHEGLSGRIVTGIFQHESRLFAATDDGLFGKELGHDAWHLVGLGGFRVEDLAILDGQHMLATAIFDWDPIVFKESKLYETVNGGANWLPVDNDFGGGFETGGIRALDYDQASSRLYGAAHDALAVSDDAGRSWQLLAGGWDGASPPFTALNLNAAKGQVWFGGQNAIEQMKLLRHDLASGATIQFSTFLLPAPATIKGITFDPSDPNHVLASGEGGILQSRNNGASWTRPLGDVDYRFYFQTVFDPRDARIIYTASWAKEFELPQPLVFEVSTDSGASWAAYRLDEPGLFGGAWSLSAVVEDGRTVVYLGLYLGGIMKVLLPSEG
jgi:photosystem II stability/assembly factor-like uncharacterized protein